MNLVEQIARMIDHEGAYGVFYSDTSADANPCEPTTRQKYFRAHYEITAIGILKLLVGQPPAKIKEDLIEFEKAGWNKMGVRLDHEAEKIIAKKY